MKKSIRDLSRRKVRTTLTILTIALGVMGMALFAVNPLADELVQEEIERENIHNLKFTLDDVHLNDTHKRYLSGIKNVEEMESRVVHAAKFKNGERTDHAYFIGIEDLKDQKVDRIIFDKDEHPGSNELLTEISNARYGLFSGGKDDMVSIFAHDGSIVEMRISGEGRSLLYARGGFISGTSSMFYADISTVRDLGNISGYNSLSFTLESTDEASVQTTIEDITEYLSGELGTTPNEMPEVREDDQWALSGILEMIMNVMYILTFLAIFCSIFLISNTMNTIVSEQKGEISQLKAIGASRFQVFRSYITTSMVLGITGSLIGIVLGTIMPLVVLSLLSGLFGFDPVFMVHPMTLVLSLAGGISIVLLSSLPALIKATRSNIREGMEGRNLNGGHSGGSLSRSLSRIKWMPGTLQMGIRGMTRKRGRSLTTVFQITLAVAVFLGLASFSYSLGPAITREIDSHDHDIEIDGIGPSSIFIDEKMVGSIEGIDGVSIVEPSLYTSFKVEDIDITAYGYQHDTVSKRHDRTLSSGRWFSAEDEQGLAKVIVMASSLSKMTSTEIGDEVRVSTPNGTHTMEVIGIDDEWRNMGLSIYLPYKTMHSILNETGRISGFYVHTDSDDHNEIDRTSVLIDALLVRENVPADIQVIYVVKERNIKENQGILDMMMITSVIIVTICLIGLMNNLSMNVLERTKEIGMLRCIGGISRSIRMVFGSEGLALAFLGWVLGIPIGYLIARLVSYMIFKMMDFTVDILYPMKFIGISLLVTMIGSFIIIQVPVWRASRMRPGDALRYQ